jgi:hypothetical protein
MPTRSLRDAADVVGGLASVTRSGHVPAFVENRRPGWLPKATGLAAWPPVLGVAARGQWPPWVTCPTDVAMLRWAGHSFAVGNAPRDASRRGRLACWAPTTRDAVAGLLPAPPRRCGAGTVNAVLRVTVPQPEWCLGKPLPAGSSNWAGAGWPRSGAASTSACIARGDQDLQRRSRRCGVWSPARQAEIRALSDLSPSRTSSRFFDARHVGDGPSTATIPAYLVMEFVAGPTLAQRLTPRPVERGRRRRDRSWRRRGVGRRALARHGAIATSSRRTSCSPATARDGWLPKLSDFGIAHRLGSGASRERRWWVGTAAYLSPEQARGGTIGTAHRRHMPSAWSCSRRSPGAGPTTGPRSKPPPRELHRPPTRHSGHPSRALAEPATRP